SKPDVQHGHRQDGAPGAARSTLVGWSDHRAIPFCTRVPSVGHRDIANGLSLLLLWFASAYRGKCLSSQVLIVASAYRRKRLSPQTRSIPDVLQEPLGGDLAAELGAARRFVHLAGDRVELGALQVAALRISDLIGRGAAAHLALDEIGERDALVGQRVAVL